MTWDFRQPLQLVVLVVTGLFGVFSILVGVSFELDFIVGSLDVLDFYFVGAFECSSCLIFLCSLFDCKLV